MLHLKDWIWYHLNSTLTYPSIESVYNVKPVYQEDIKMWYRLKLYALFINGKNKTALYRQWFVI